MCPVLAVPRESKTMSKASREVASQSDSRVAEKRYRILYVQRPNGGGSATGLYDMVRVLDRERFEPVVLFYQQNDFCEAFRELGAHVMVLSGRTGARPLPALVSGAVGGLRDSSNAVRQVNRLIRSDWPLARRIARLIKREHIDLVHNNDNPRGDRASMIAARLAGVPQVSHVRFLPDYFRPIDRRLATFVDFFIYVSTAVEQQYRTEIGVPAWKGKVIYDPFDFASFGNGGRSAAQVRTELGLGDHHQVVSNVGRIVPWKGQDVFLRAMAQVVRSHPNAVALIVGSAAAKPAAQEYYCQLERLVQELRLSDNVIFTGFRRDIPEIMAASDVVVHSASRPEPFGRVVVEAMAANRPLVATAAGGVLEIIDDQETGLLVPLEDSARMAQAIETLLEDAALAERMGQRARREAEARYEPQRFADAIRRIYEGTLAGRAHKSTRG